MGYEDRKEIAERLMEERSKDNCTMSAQGGLGQCWWLQQELRMIGGADVLPQSSSERSMSTNQTLDRQK